MNADELGLLDVEFPATSIRGGGNGGRNEFCPRRDMIYVDALGSSTAAAFAHEFAHFSLHASTPYGLFLDHLTKWRLNCAIRYCQGMQRDVRRTVRYPVYELAKKFPTQEDLADRASWQIEAQKELIRTCVRPWSHAVFLENIMEGKKLPTVVNAKEGTAILALEVMEMHLNKLYKTELAPSGAHPVRQVRSLAAKEFPEIKELPDWLEQSPVPACPSVGPKEQGRVLGATSLFEGHALMAENVRPDIIKMLAKDVKKAFYLDVDASVLWKYGIERVKTAETYWMLKKTSFALCDLALFTPIGPFYSRLRPAESTWFDVHPGHRFLAALNYVYENGLWLTSLEDPEYRAFQNAVCQGLKWPMPDMFAAIGATLQGAEFARHRKACEIRQLHPNIYVEVKATNADLAKATEELLAVEYPLVYIRDRGRTNGIHHGNMLMAVDKIMDYFLEDVTWKLMKDTRVDLLGCLPPNLDYTSFTTNITNDDQMLELILGAAPYLEENLLEPFVYS